MIDIEGKYNTAHIMIDDIDPFTREQIQRMMDNPAFSGSRVAVMPDCHAGVGAVIGFTMKMNDYIIPNIVGVDIGCGMLSACFGEIDIDPAELDSFIKKRIPSSTGINRQTEDGLGQLAEETAQVCETIGIEADKALRAIGSLSGGNHFIEAGRGTDGRLWITIHSGSRNFGLQVAMFSQRKAKEKHRDRPDNVPGLESLETDSRDGREYLKHLRTAQLFAAMNRRVMMSRISEIAGDPIETHESVHNFIGDDDIIRKGATPARDGETVILPFNMRDGIALCRGKGSAEYNYSAPHGAGRVLSRTQAKASLDLSELQNQMKQAGIYTTTATRGTLDEAPAAYKDRELILKNISATVEVIDFIKPFYNFKASG